MGEEAVGGQTGSGQRSSSQESGPPAVCVLNSPGHRSWLACSRVGGCFRVFVKMCVLWPSFSMTGTEELGWGGVVRVPSPGYFFPVGVLGLGAFLEMVGILEGLLPGRRGVSEVSEQAERVSRSSEASEASLPLRLLARLPARLPARLAAPLAEEGVRLESGAETHEMSE